ncbi:TRAP transporter large permease subunit [Alicyclobacillus tolerans]|uniref:TRAP transporter large permease n=1 Tax=Alicyclobacillus tolerans TaxID=90970 RepID=UPI001F1A7D9B|nr:TRAP transporter large permease subunit [Alicyclobacillus tolerans]MCF8565151.1 TRAP transporter large permease subunit [Alicyclobacillus tolerans]
MVLEEEKGLSIHGQSALQRKVSSVITTMSSWFDSFLLNASIVLLCSMVIVLALGVFYRYVLNSPLSWTNELGTYMFVWLVFLGTTATIRRNEMPSVSFVIQRLPRSIKKGVNSLSQWIGLIMGILLVGQGILACLDMWAQRSPALQIPMGIPLLIMPLAGLGIAIHYVHFLINNFQSGVLRNTSTYLSLLIAVLLSATIKYLPQATVNVELLVILIVGFLIGLPIAVVLMTTAAAVMQITGTSLVILPERLFSGTENIVLIAIPLFMLTGALMQNAGIARRLVDFSSALVGRFRGGLAYVDIVTSAFFADLSGSPVADTAAVGSIMIPEMVKKGYNNRFAAALQAAAGSMGMLIPPSIATIIYAWVANVSVANMFLASLLPAVLMMATFGIVAAVYTTKHNYPRERKYSLPEAFQSFYRAFGGLLTPIIIFGGILTGIVTPTEAGVVAVLYTVLVSFIGYRSLTITSLYSSLREAILNTSRVMFILANAMLISWVLTIQQIPQQLAALMLDVSHNRLVLIILLMIILVLIHEVLETSSTLILIVPLIIPVFQQLGVNPIYLGILFLINSSLGIISPPVGFLLYIAGTISRSTLEEVTMQIWPFWLAIIIDLALLIIFPGIVSILPHLLGVS